jgi:DNA polymerase-4
MELAMSALSDNPAELQITLLAVSVSNLIDQPALQLELPLGLDDGRHRPGSVAGAARWAVDRSVDSIRSRFGRDSVGYATVVFSSEGRVPEAFRELAEHKELRSHGIL